MKEIHVSFYRANIWAAGAVSVLAAAFSIGATPARAGAVTDPSGDFLPTFAGTRNADLDVLSASAVLNGSNIILSGTVAGPVGANALYVFGIDRGVGNVNFANIANPLVVFDSVVTLTGSGVTAVVDRVSGAKFALPAGAATISGSSFQIDLPVSLLPSEGFDVANWAANLWSEDPAVAGPTNIADFAPDNADFTIGTNIPEPRSLELLMFGAVAVGLARCVSERRTKSRIDRDLGVSGV